MDADIRIDTKALDRVLESLTAPNVGKTVLNYVRAMVFMLVGHTGRSKLLGQVLRRRTGTLIRSITASPRFAVEGDRVVGSWGTHLGYGRAHELGFSGLVPVRSHERRLKLRTASGRVRSERSRLNLALRGQKTRATVRAHDRYVRIWAKRYLRTSLQEKQPALGYRLRRALYLLAREGSVPSVSDIGAGGSLL